MSQPTVGRIVHYTLNEGDVSLINSRTPQSYEGPTVRNHVQAGDTYPAIVVRVFDPSTTTANLQVLLDGNCTYWATSRTEGDGAGHWAWPPRV
ncbi:hypothetical protein AB0B89_27130 [Sphaerisporangium sp. NPDC049002]|uniref:hypothetical protein n=1 Tax=Sphaerisporangium sp. NPDC049002 TaxID=3155392 RepID=UPI0033CBFD40